MQYYYGVTIYSVYDNHSALSKAIARTNVENGPTTLFILLLYLLVTETPQMNKQNAPPVHKTLTLFS